MKELLGIKAEVEKRLNSRKIAETYRHAYRLNSKGINARLLNNIAEALEINVVWWLIENGYQPENEESFFRIITEEFDYGNCIGLAAEVQAIMDDGTLPINARIIFALLRKNRLLRREIELKEHCLSLLRPRWLTNLVCRIVRVFKRKEVYEERWSEDDDN